MAGGWCWPAGCVTLPPPVSCLYLVLVLDPAQPSPAQPSPAQRHTATQDMGQLQQQESEDPARGWLWVMVVKSCFRSTRFLGQMLYIDSVGCWVGSSLWRLLRCREASSLTSPRPAQQPVCLCVGGVVTHVSGECRHVTHVSGEGRHVTPRVRRVQTRHACVKRVQTRYSWTPRARLQQCRADMHCSTADRETSVLQRWP